MPSTSKAKPREGPSRIKMGIERDMSLRLARPLKADLRHLYRQVYAEIPPPGFGEFIAFCASLGMEVVREKYLRPAEPGEGDTKP